MEKEGFFYLGKILKPYGSKGHVLVRLDVDDPDRYRRMRLVYIGVGGDRVPYFIESVELKEAGKAVLKFEDIHTPEDAEPLPGNELFLPLSALPPLKGKKFYFHEVEGFAVTDEVHGEIGILESISEMPTQALLRIRQGRKEILVPLTDEVLRKVDRKNRKLHIRAPEGLIELYLNP
ncbi:MAG TPA: ribosome maturation factor RimM [Bacteroidales bacterium]|nr:ribosome maturation factor RimM [Bacteroidales bacterium]